MSEDKKMCIIVTKGTLDWAYPPFILATTAAAMDVETTLFFTFYGLNLLKKDVSHLQISTLGNPAMEMPRGRWTGLTRPSSWRPRRRRWTSG